jgi:hypothetical protein
MVTPSRPANEVPGYSPISPVTVVAPVFVIVEPARIAKLEVDLRSTGG